jgi:serine/threonine-protein kinase
MISRACGKREGWQRGAPRTSTTEEFELGARIDERTTVFTMGRTVAEFLALGSADIADLIAHACDADPRHRFQSLPEFYAAWSAAASSGAR